MRFMTDNTVMRSLPIFFGKTPSLYIGYHFHIGYVVAFIMNNAIKQLTPFLQLTVIFAGLLLIGWLLHGFDAPLGVCIGTLLVCCYLVWAGVGGIALASVWVVSLMSVAAIKHLWLRDMPRPPFRYIPFLILANWLLALAIVWQLGKVSDAFRQNRLPAYRVALGLIALIAFGLCAGWGVYPDTVLFLATLRGQ